MSLVNDMLRDLDRRKRLPVSNGSEKYSDSESVSGKPFKLLALAAVALVLTGGGVYYFKAIQDTSPAGTVRLPAANQAEGASGPQQAIVREAMPEVTEEPAPDTVVLRIERTNISEDGFNLVFSSRSELAYEVLSRNAYGMELALQTPGSVELPAGNIPGLSLIKSDSGYRAIMELNREADYRLSSVQDDARQRLTLEAVYRDIPQPVQTADNTGENVEPASQQIPAAQTSRVAETPVNQPPAQEQDAASFRTPRSLSFEERDINNRRSAILQIQRGQIMAAYEQLFRFLDENPEAHQSRETLATLLFAQQEYLQANAVVDQGMSLAPNYAAYKKIKARLFMLENRVDEAVSLLLNVPPVLSSDPEYFELLASVYQQGGNHQGAIETYQSLIRNDRNQPRWWVGMGVSHEALGNIQQAVSSYHAALQFDALEASLRQYSQNRVRILGN